jgi:hypothetical protein
MVELTIVPLGIIPVVMKSIFLDAQTIILALHGIIFKH